MSLGKRLNGWSGVSRGSKYQVCLPQRYVLSSDEPSHSSSVSYVQVILHELRQTLAILIALHYFHVMYNTLHFGATSFKNQVDSFPNEHCSSLGSC